MALFKTLLFLLTFIFICSTGCFAVVQEATTQTEGTGFTEVLEQVDNTDTQGKKKVKKKDKLRINETFYINLLIDLLTIIIIVGFIYYPNYHKKDVFFTYFLFNIAIFLLTFLLNEIKISMGAAFGLFAVFSMLRYRTEGISLKDMTYLFIVIAIGLISAIKLEYYELGIINGVLVVATFALDGNIILKREYSKRVQYEKIEMIKPENHAALIEDLKERTGLNIHRFSISKIDFLRDMATMEVFFYNNINNKDSEKTIHNDFVATANDD